MFSRPRVGHCEQNYEAFLTLFVIMEMAEMLSNDTNVLFDFHLEYRLKKVCKLTIKR